MENLFVTSKKGKSAMGHKRCQLFSTDKGYVYVVLIKYQKEDMETVKIFDKEFGTPDVLISDASLKQKSQNIIKLCNEIVTTLILLEEVTPLIQQNVDIYWPNKRVNREGHEIV